MRLLEYNNDGEFGLTKEFSDDIPQYAILSHTWGTGNEEVTFRDLVDGTGKTKPGYDKIRFCGEQARSDNLQYFWVDTCCIDKSNSVELQEAINSMFRWYQNSAKCYVYLSDVSRTASSANVESNQLSWELDFRDSKWFTRGWTLQELLAPSSVEFFSQEYNRLGDKRSLERHIHEITRIAVPALRGTPVSQFGVDERLSWAENRLTTRKEDKAYSLLGLFNIQIPLLYGEGRERALKRLREEIDKASNGLENNLVNRLPYAVDAPFNSYAKQHSPSCLPNTRVELLQEIYHWADGQDDRRIFWLNGLAGTGKSTIARTVARRYFDQKHLGASFFFARGGGDVGHASKFVTSIAVQLASSIPTLRQYLFDAVTEYSDIASRSLCDQWQLLILGPLSKLHENGCRASYILVVDALDECDDDKNIRIILQLLAEVRSLKRVRLRVFLTSRPEVPVRHGFYQLPEAERCDVVLHNISPSIVDHDISIFLEYSLGLIGEEDSQETGWPGAEVIKSLVQSASGLFIWAATACRFIREGLFADERLRTLLDGDASAHAATPEEHLNGMYLTVLRNSIQPGFGRQDKEKFYNLLRDILGSLIAIFSPLSLDSLSRLLAIPKQRVERMLKDLHAILDIPKDLTLPLRLHHPSFRDFLFAEKKCGDQNFWVDEKQAHLTLAARCIQLMSTSLKADICGVGRPGALVTNIESSRVQRCLPLEVQYASLYWIQHLQKSGTRLQDNDLVHQFLQEHLLHWLEALGWMRKVSEGIYAITLLQSIALASECSSLQTFIYDVKRFALYSRSGIEQAPFQACCSALIFAPMKSVVRSQFRDRMPQWMRRLPKVEANWEALLQTLEGHRGPVRAVAFSPDGSLLVSGSEDETIRLWDARSGARLQTLNGHLSSVRTVAFSPDGKMLASGSGGGTILLWDVITGVPPQMPRGYTTRVSAIAFSPDSKLLASGWDDRMVRLWDVGTQVLLRTLEGHLSWVKAVAFSPDGKLLASGSGDQTIRLWDAGTGLLLQILKGHLDYVYTVAFSPDGKLLVSGSRDGTVRLWNASTGAPLQTLKGHSSSVRTVAFSPDGKMLASGSGGGTILLWDAITGAPLQSLGGRSYYVYALAFSPDSKLLASGSGDETVRLWDVGPSAPLQALDGHLSSVDTEAVAGDKLLASTSRDDTVRLCGADIDAPLQRPNSHPNPVRAIAFSPDGKLLVSSSANGIIRLWDTGTSAPLRKSKGHSHNVRAVAVSPDSKLLAAGSEDGTVTLWDVGTVAVLQTLKGHSNIVRVVAFSPNGKLLASGSQDTTVKLWDVGMRALLQTFKGCLGWVSAVAFSTDGKLLASCWSNKSIKLWDVSNCEPLRILEGHTSWVYTITFSLNGKLLASGSEDKTVRLWDARTGTPRQTLNGHLARVWTVAFSPDSKLLASCSEDRTIRLWDARTGALLQTLEGHSSIVRGIDFSPDGRLLASGSSDGTIRLWDGSTGATLKTLESYSSRVRALDFSSDGKLLASGSGDGTVRLWDAGTGALLRTFQGHSDYIYSVAFSSDGKLVASGSGDGTVRLWEACNGALLQTFTVATLVSASPFPVKGSSIETDCGQLGIGWTFLHRVAVPPTASALQSHPGPDSHGVFIEDEWIRSGRDRMLWLPPDYRPSCSAVYGGIVGLGHFSGHVSIFEFDFP